MFRVMSLALLPMLMSTAIQAQPMTQQDLERLGPYIRAYVECGQLQGSYLAATTEVEPTDIAITAEVRCRTERNGLFEQLSAGWSSQANSLIAMADEEFRKQTIAEAVGQRAYQNSR